MPNVTQEMIQHVTQDRKIRTLGIRFKNDNTSWRNSNIFQAYYAILWSKSSLILIQRSIIRKYIPVPLTCIIFVFKIYKWNVYGAIYIYKHSENILLRTLFTVIKLLRLSLGHCLTWWFFWSSRVVFRVPRWIKAPWEEAAEVHFPLRVDRGLAPAT
jgi:hypothetical protein